MNLISTEQGLAVLPWMLGLVALAVGGFAFVSLGRRLATVERQLEELRRRVERPQRTHAPAGPHVVAVPQGPRDLASPPARAAVVAPAKVPTLIAVPDLFAEDGPNSERGDNPSPRSADREIRDFQERFAEILELDDSGLPSTDISRTCGLPVGQVELIVSLNRRLRRAEHPTTPPR